MTQKSETIIELAKALSKFQGELKPAKKGEVNPFFKSKYADLAGVWEVVRDPLSKNGLSVAQLPYIDNDKIVLTTLLLHVSGEWLSSDLTIMPVKPNDPQAVGSALTYARRYSLGAMLGVAAEEDDDAESAMDRKKPESIGQNKPETSPEHMCPVHHVPFFKSAKMKSYAHPIAGTKDWCHEPSKPDIPQAEKDSKELSLDGGTPETSPAAPKSTTEASQSPAGQEVSDKPSDEYSITLEYLENVKSKTGKSDRDIIIYISKTFNLPVPARSKLADMINALSQEQVKKLKFWLNSLVEAAGK